MRNSGRRNEKAVSCGIQGPVKALESDMMARVRVMMRSGRSAGGAEVQQACVKLSTVAVKPLSAF